jgi:ubiquinone/menaquinone biosynthesis C-methylase UbiE
MLKRYIAGKFRHPDGLSGRLVGRLMATGNRKAVDWTVSLLDIEADDHLLEVGFGPGVAIELARRAGAARIAGVDSSSTMVDVARRRNAHAVEAGLVDLRCGDAAFLPYASRTFDKVFSIHCIYFWANPVRALREFQRVLVSGGIVAVTILPKDRWREHKTVPPADLFTLYGAAEVAALLEQAGFHDVRVEDGEGSGKLRCACIIGTKRSGAAAGNARESALMPRGTRAAAGVAAPASRPFASAAASSTLEENT